VRVDRLVAPGVGPARGVGDASRTWPAGRGRGSRSADERRAVQRSARRDRHAGLVRHVVDRAADTSADRPRAGDVSAGGGEATRVSLVQAAPRARSFAAVARDYISLLKLRVVVLLDATAIGVMVPASHGHPRVASVLAVLAGALIYVFVYTIWLKRSTPQNIVIGGAAGAVPPLVGWAAATGQLDLTALSLFAVIFFWTPPHFWALAQLIKSDYARANIPML